MDGLSIGTAVADGKAVGLDPRRFNRHTFWCGQSGSGKTYALGVVLEQLLLSTRLPMLILDPNADFVRFNRARAETPAPERAAIEGADIRVFRTGAAGAEALHVRYVDLSAATKAAVLRLDPIRDAEEYNILLHLEGEPAKFDTAELITRLRASGDPMAARLAYRMENLQVLDWPLWSRGSGSVLDDLAERPRATVLDIGGGTHPDEGKVAALAVLESLWAQRESRQPMLIVIDEAHNLCQPNPGTAVERALTEQLIQIAAEGRKFGLWLFLSTQRPTKIHPNVLSQCDNLGLMRVNAPRDLAELSEVFGYAPDELVARAQSFTQGQALFAGGFVERATVVQVGARLTEEHGSDVRVPLIEDPDAAAVART
ncbi:ATP-binding protein [Leucobacter chromiireducens]|uniref:ATP-binding protein n=1 Tax=Leucobacter chromiireducens TaxID=283877 RepID=UPI000F6390F0|nr:ATP-binding protein [Leucobacter chromiireducens]